LAGETVGNPNLDPESSNTYEVGADYFQSGFDGSLTYFHTDFKDKIVTDFLSDGSQSWINSGDATIAGFEIELGYDLGVPMGWQWEVAALCERYPVDPARKMRRPGKICSTFPTPVLQPVSQ
jgi:outer membrane receptor for ferrienterochelin and colicin